MRGAERWMTQLWLSSQEGMGSPQRSLRSTASSLVTVETRDITRTSPTVPASSLVDTILFATIKGFDNVPTNGREP